MNNGDKRKRDYSAEEWAVISEKRISHVTKADRTISPTACKWLRLPWGKTKPIEEER